jgi:hypothetical protein
MLVILFRKEKVIILFVLKDPCHLLSNSLPPLTQIFYCISIFLNLNRAIMKTIAILKVALLCAIMLSFSGCEKEPLSELQTSNESALGKKGKQVERPFKGRMVSTTWFLGDAASGWVSGSLLPAWLYGSGEGNATHIGKYTAYFSQYATAVDQNSTYVTGAPVTMFFTEELLLYFTASEVALMEEMGISIVLLDKHGNSIWGVRTAETREVDSDLTENTPVYQEVRIVGGTGRFAGASGTFTLEGYTDLSFSGPGLGRLELNGVIVY